MTSEWGGRKGNLKRIDDREENSVAFWELLELELFGFVSARQPHSVYHTKTSLGPKHKIVINTAHRTGNKRLYEI
jgi:hypothetical protein